MGAFNGKFILNGSIEAAKLSSAAKQDIRADGYSDVLKILEHPSNHKRIIVNPSIAIMDDGSTIIAEMNQLRLKFDGAQIDFQTGQIRSFDDTTIIDTFSVPSVTNGLYKWVSVSLIPSTIDANNMITASLVVLASPDQNASKILADRPAFQVGKPLAQIALLGSGGSIANILYADIERLSFGSGGGSNSQIIKEVPTGTINGSNTIFTLVNEPQDQSSTFVFLDGLYVRNSLYTVVSDTITFTNPPQPFQEIDVYYYPDPLGGIISGGSTDLTSISVDIRPTVAGANSVGTVIKPWKDIFLKDKSTADVWRLEIDNGVIQAILVP